MVEAEDDTAMGHEGMGIDLPTEQAVAAIYDAEDDDNNLI
jgi:hypothetical protein